MAKRKVDITYTINKTLIHLIINENTKNKILNKIEILLICTERQQNIKNKMVFGLEKSEDKYIKYSNNKVTKVLSK